MKYVLIGFGILAVSFVLVTFEMFVSYGLFVW